MKMGKKLFYLMAFMLIIPVVFGTTIMNDNFDYVSDMTTEICNPLHLNNWGVYSRNCDGNLCYFDGSIDLVNNYNSCPTNNPFNSTLFTIYLKINNSVTTTGSPTIFDILYTHATGSRSDEILTLRFNNTNNAFMVNSNNFLPSSLNANMEIGFQYNITGVNVNLKIFEVETAGYTQLLDINGTFTNPPNKTIDALRIKPRLTSSYYNKFYLDYVILENSSFSYETATNTSTTTTPTANFSDYDKCPNPLDTNYIFCENFDFMGTDISGQGWNYNTSLTNITPEFYVFNAYGSVKTNDTPMFHNFVGILGNYDYGYEKTLYNYNIERLKFSYIFKPNESNLIAYLQSIGNWSDTSTFGIYNRFIYLYSTNTTNKFYIYNYSRDDFDEFITLNVTSGSVKVDAIMYKARSYNNIPYCDFFVSINDGTEHNSSVYRAGYQPRFIIPDGLFNPFVITPCEYVTAVGFEGEYLTTGTRIDDVNVYVLSRNSELKFHLLDRCIDENYYTAEFPASPIPMGNKIVNISDVNYTTDSQGYLTITGLGTGYFNVYVNAFNVTNKFILLSNSSQDYQEICFNRFSNYEPTDTGDFGNIIMNTLTDFGLKSTASKLILFLIIIIIVNVWFGIARLPSIVVVIINVICVALGVVLNLVPFWVVFLILISLVGGFLLFGLKRGEE